MPTVGFGPGEEDVAHSVIERVPIRHLVEAAQFYAAFPLAYVATREGSND
jgi:acetylornithine deacetylase/succinyl-diaminopimelate desuccinylase-like protein